MESNESDVTEAATPKIAAASYPPKYEYLQDLAINRYGWSIPIPAGIDKYNLTYLTAETWGSVDSWQWGSEELMEAGIVPWKTPFSSTVKEPWVAPKSAGKCHCVLVGFGVTDLSPEHYKQSPAPPVRRQWASHEPGHKGPWICDPVPIPDLASKKVFMAVAKVVKSRPWRADIFAWLGPSNGSGKLYRIRNADCFYLPIFRMQPPYINSRSDSRVRAWSNEIMNACYMPIDPMDVPASPPQTQSLKTPTWTTQTQDLHSESQRNDLVRPAPSTNEATNSHGCDDPFGWEMFLNAGGQEDVFDWETFLDGIGQDGLGQTNDSMHQDMFDCEAFLKNQGALEL